VLWSFCQFQPVIWQTHATLAAEILHNHNCAFGDFPTSRPDTNSPACTRTASIGCKWSDIDSHQLVQSAQPFSVRIRAGQPAIQSQPSSALTLNIRPLDLSTYRNCGPLLHCCCHDIPPSPSARSTIQAAARVTPRRKIPIKRASGNNKSKPNSTSSASKTPLTCRYGLAMPVRP